MGIFDIDSGADNHLLNEQFHVFSKSPASVATALGDASNRSGHTVTASDVWGQEIPAFFYAKTQSVADSYKPLAKTNDLCRIGNSVAIFENGNWVVKYNSYTDIPDGHKFKNANGDEVIRFHKNRLAYNLNLDNNAADDGLNTTAKIQGWDDVNGKVYDYVATAPKFVTQFVTSTDKIVDGIPSKGFGPFVMAGTTTGDITKVLPEGTSDSNHYIANSFAGIIQFNKARTDAIYVHAFEYCGKTLKSAYSDIVELDEKLSKISVTAAGGVQAVSDAAKAAGLAINSVDVEGVTTPTLDLTTATITDGVFATTAGNKAKLVTAQDVENYVAKNAKVSVNGQSATTITVAGTSAASADLVKIAVAEDKNTSDAIGLTLTASVTTATVGADGSVTNDGLVKASDAAKIAEKAAGGVDVGVTGITINGGTKQTGNVAISVVTGVIDAGASAGSLPSGGNTHGVTLNLVDNKAYVAVDTATYDSTSKKFATGSSSTNYLTTAADVTAYVTDAISDAISSIDFPDVKVAGGNTDYGISFSSDEKVGAGSSHYMHISTASYTASTDSWTNKGHLITGATVEAFVNDVVSEVSSDLATLENKVNAYHEAGVSYKVHTGTTLPDLTVPANVETYKNVILLVPTTERGPNDLDESEAISGSYIEYLCVKTGETTYAWEKIGTTEADLSGYVRKVSAQNETTNHTSPVYGEVSSDGYLTLGVDSATSDKLGVSKLFTGHYNQMASVADKSNTAVSLETISNLFDQQNSQYVTGINNCSGPVTLCVHNYSGQDKNDEGDAGSNWPRPSKHANLWGMTFFSNSGSNITLVDDFVGMSRSYLTTANLPSDAVSVENNFVYDNRGVVITTIRPERMVTGFNATTATGLTSFVGDLNNLETCVRNGGLSTFYHISALTTFIGDLSSLTDGSNMFERCTSLTTFIGDLSSLEKGFWGNGEGGMFKDTNLTIESVENIADALPENPVVDTSTKKGYITISWYQLTSDTAERQKLVDALSGVVDKGWALVTNLELRTMFDTEKYKVVEYTIQPLDLDSEPQQIAYVIKK